MTDNTGRQWAKLIKLLKNHFPLNEHIAALSYQLSPSLTRTIRISIALCGLFNTSSASWFVPAELSPYYDIPVSEEEKLDFLAYILERWVVLRHRFASQPPLTQSSAHRYQIRFLDGVNGKLK